MEDNFEHSISQILADDDFGAASDVASDTEDQFDQADLQPAKELSRSNNLSHHTRSPAEVAKSAEKTELAPERKEEEDASLDGSTKADNYEECPKLTSKPPLASEASKDAGNQDNPAGQCPPRSRITREMDTQPARSRSDARMRVCCDRCTYNPRTGRTCACLVPASKRRTDMGPNGCNPCGCRGCTEGNLEDTRWHSNASNYPLLGRSDRSSSTVFSSRQSSRSPGIHPNRRDVLLNGCCKPCMRAFSETRRACRCQVPASVRNHPLPIDGCTICGCHGCSPNDRQRRYSEIPERIAAVESGRPHRVSSLGRNTPRDYAGRPYCLEPYSPRRLSPGQRRSPQSQYRDNGRPIHRTDERWVPRDLPLRGNPGPRDLDRRDAEEWRNRQHSTDRHYDSARRLSPCTGDDPARSRDRTISSDRVSWNAPQKRIRDYPSSSQRPVSRARYM